VQHQSIQIDTQAGFLKVFLLKLRFDLLWMPRSRAPCWTRIRKGKANVTSTAGAETPYVTAAPYSIVAVDLPRTSGSIDTMFPKR
jgi:hypothetical protein